MAGLTSTGLTIKRLEDLRADMAARAQSDIDSAARTDDDSVIGHVLGVFAVSLSEVWQLAQDLYDAFNPDNAEGIQLDNLAGIIGIIREAATEATGIVTLSGTALTPVPAGTIVRSSVDGSEFLTDEDVTIATGGTVDVGVTAEEAGALTVLAGEVTEIVTPVSGLDSVTNAADFNRGTDVETDDALRLRIAASLQITGAGTDNAIRANVVALEDVDYCSVTSNRTDTTDSKGRPPHSFHVVIWPDTGVDTAQVFATIFAKMPSGIYPHGSEVGTVVDAQGKEETVRFDYAADEAIGITIDVTTTAQFPADGVAQIEQRVLEIAAEEWTVGVDVRVLSIQAAVDEVAGVDSIVLKLDKKSVAYPPVGTVNIPIDEDEIATLDAADLTVTPV